MKKYRLSLILIFALLLSACSQTAEVEPTPISEDEFLATLESGPSSSAAICTAQSVEVVDVAEADDWITGPEQYSVTLTYYCDYQSEACNLFSGNINQIRQDFPEDLRVILRHLPVQEMDKDLLAAQAVEAAGLQDAFWEMNDQLNANWGDWVEMTPEAFSDWLLEQAGELELDQEKFAADLTSDALVKRVMDKTSEAQAAGLVNPPAALIDGFSLTSQFYGYDAMYTLLANYSIPLGRLANNQFSECPPMTIDEDKQYTATLHTEAGDIVIGLYPDIAPFAVNNFIFLAENDFYDDVTFHRVIDGFVAQGGDPSGTGQGGPGYFFSIEVSPDVTFDRPGLFAMANAGPTANGCQFFITYDSVEQLNGQFTIFGEVLEGMDVARELKLRDPQQNPFAEPGTRILDVTIEEK